MSGQPVKSKSDQAKYLDKYMENLALEIDIQKKNEDANRIYKQTGQIPPASSMPDNRTVEQKLADVQVLKQGIIKDLKSIMSPSLASALIDEIDKSKFNTEGSLLRFFAQRAPEMIREIEKKYKYGLADFNDVIGTSKFIESYYVESQKSLASFKDISGRARGPDNYSENILVQTRKNLQELLNTLMTRTDMTGNVANKVTTDTTLKKISLIIDVMKAVATGYGQPNKDFLESIIDDVSKAYIYSINEPGNPVQDEINRLTFMVRNARDTIEGIFPDPNLISTYNNKVKKAFDLFYQNPTSQQAIAQQYIDAINKLFEPIDYNELIGLMEAKRIMIELWDTIRPYSQRFQTTENTANTERITERAVQLENPIDQPQFPMTNEGEKLARIGELYTRLYNEIANNRPWDLPNIDANIGSIIDYQNAPANDKRQMVQDFIDYIDQTYPQTEIQVLKNNLMNAQPNYARIIAGFGMRGGRIGRPKLPKFTERIDRQAGMKPSLDFVPFGSYIINRRKMGEGIVNIKTSSGSNLAGFPNQRVSTKLAKVFHKIIGGSIPSFEDLSELDDTEKAYLHKVAKKSNIIDRLSIPSPSKDQMDKDIHSFEVMKGQIMAGNDNKDLVKKFKLTVLKLKQQGLLPKAQADEIISDISSLGY